MSEEQIVMHCAPTLTDCKAGSLFAAEYKDRASLQKEITQLNERLSFRNVRTILLGFTKSRALVYIFRPDRVQEALRNSTARSILEERGYDPSNLSGCLSRLRLRLAGTDGFPHEIGLFLGYPAEEVRAFIRNDRPCRFTGTWKVYCDEDLARRMFRIFRLCTAACQKRLAAGVPLEKLTVERRKTK
ncbi:MAG: DUF3793 family protein [Solobacterium sp.]|nr:DUF3793 family protein [Solobacterium sp.]